MGNLAEILAIVFGTTSVVELVTTIILWKQTKQLKNNEVKMSNADAQRQDIDLSDYFKDRMLAMMEQFSEKQQNGNDNQKYMMDQLQQLSEQNERQEKTLAELLVRMDAQEKATSDMAGYMNGGYQEHLRQKYASLSEGGDRPS